MLIRHESWLTRRSKVLIVSRNMSVELLDYEAHLDLVFTAIWSDQKFKARPEVRARQTVILEHHTRFSCSMGPALSALTAYWTLLFPLFFVDSKHYFWHSRSGLQHVTDLRSSLNFNGLIIETTNLIKAAHSSMGRLQTESREIEGEMNGITMNSVRWHSMSLDSICTALFLVHLRPELILKK